VTYLNKGDEGEMPDNVIDIKKKREELSTKKKPKFKLSLPKFELDIVTMSELICGIGLLCIIITLVLRG